MTRHRVWISLAAVLTASLLSACATEPRVEPPYAAVLSQAAAQASAAWVQTARVSDDLLHAPSVPSVTKAPPGLQQPVRVDWTGPPTPLLRALAHRVGWEFRTLGAVPPSSPVVSVHGDHSVLVALEQVGSQLPMAQVQVDAAARVIVLNWGP
ncbi:MAG: DotD/TraH family lipoprotein [Acidiferrobacteraceae bacterium]